MTFQEILPAIFPLVLPVACLLAGVLTSWLLFRLKLERTYERTQSELELAQATMNERLAAREQYIVELKSLLDQTISEKAGLRGELGLQSEKRAKAEEKSMRIPELETLLTERTEQIELLQTQKSELVARVSPRSKRRG